jgi:hypothetical protein
MAEIKQDKPIGINEADELLSVHLKTLERWDRGEKLHTMVVN